MGKRKQRSDPADAALQQLIESDQPSDQDSPDLKWARAYRQGQRATPSATLDEDVGFGLVQSLADAHDLCGLQELAQCELKILRKAARSALHRLKTQGVSIFISAPKKTRGSVGSDSSADPKNVYGIITAYDPHCQRVVVFVDSSDRDIRMTQVKISPRRGILSGEQGRMSRRQFRVWMQVFREHRISYAKCSADDVCWLIQHAIALSNDSGHVLATSVRMALGKLPEAKRAEHPGQLPDQQPATDGSFTPLDLYPLNEFCGFVPEHSTIQRIGVKLSEVATSRVIVDESQRSAQLSHVLERELGDFWTPQMLACFRQYLLDTTHLFAMSARAAEAAACYRAATFLEEESRGDEAQLFRRHFLARYLDTSIGVQSAQEDNRALTQDSRLILP